MMIQHECLRDLKGKRIGDLKYPCWCDDALLILGTKGKILIAVALREINPYIATNGPNLA